MNTDPIYVTFEFNGNLGDEVERVKLGIKGLGDMSASTYKRMLESSSNAFQAMSENNRALAISIQEDITYLKQLAAVQKSVDEAYSEGTMTASAYVETKANLAMQEAEYRQSLQGNMSALNESIEREQQAVGSIEAKVEALDRLQEAYRKLSAVDRDSQEGEQLLSQIRNLKAELGQLDSAYKSATGGSQNLLDGISRMPGPLGQAANGIKGMTKAALAFIATPLGMFIAAISAGLAALFSWFKRTEEGQNALAVGSAAFSAVLNNVLDVVDKVGEWLFKAFTNPKKALTDLTDFIKDQLTNRLSAIADMGAAIVKIFSGDMSGGLADFGKSLLQLTTGVEDVGNKLVDFYDKTNERAKAGVALTERRNALDIVERNALKEKADLQARLDKLRNKAYDMSVPEKERVQYLKEALAVSDKINNKDIAIAKEKYEIQKAQNALGTSLSKEEKQAEAEAYSAFKEAEAKKYSARNMMTRQINSITRTIESSVKRRAEAEAWLANKQKELSNEQIRTLLSVEEKKLSLEQDSFDKKQKQNRLNYEKELLEIKEFETNKLKEAREVAKRLHQEQTGSDKGFDFAAYQEQLPEGLRPADIAKEVTEKTDLANQVFDKSEENLLKSLTDKYLSYADERLEIERRFNNDIATLRVARDKAETDVEKDRLERSIAKATADKGKELMSFDFDRLKESPEYVRAFEDLKNTSTETLNSLLEQLDGMKTKAAEVLSPDQLREYTTTIQKILDELVSRSPFEALANAQRELVAANNELCAAKSQLDAVLSGSDKTITQVQAQERYKAALDKVAQSSAKVIKAQKEIREQTNSLYNVIKNLGGVLGGATGDILSLVGDIGLFVDKTVDGIELVAQRGVQALSAIEKASVILGIISTAVQVVQKLSSVVSDMTEENAEAVAEAKTIEASYWDAVNYKIERQIELMKDLKNVSQEQVAVTIADAKQEKKEQIWDYDITKTLTKDFEPWIENVLKAKEDAVARGDKDLADRLGNVLNLSSGKIKKHGNKKITWTFSDFLGDMTEDDLVRLREIPAVWSLLPEEIQNSIIELDELRQKEEEVKEAANEMFTGTNVNSIADSIIKGFAEGKRSAADFADDFQEMLNNAVLQGIKMKALEEPLRQWYENFAEASGSGLTEDKIAVLKEQYDKIIADAARQLEDAEKVTGMSIDGSTRSAAAKGIAAMSQDSANELNGNFNALLIYSKNTSEGVQSINAFLVQGLSVLTNIERNTSHLEGIGKDMGVVKSGIQEMINKGLILRKQ